MSSLLTINPYFQIIRGVNTKLNLVIRNVYLFNYDKITLYKTLLSSDNDQTELGYQNMYYFFAVGVIL